jgi:thiol-disulfide isomerase/thioredoxin
LVKAIHSIIVLGILWTSTFCSCTDQDSLRVKLSREFFSNDPPFVGISNVFFSREIHQDLDYPATWHDVQSCILIDSDIHGTFTILNYKDGKGIQQYSVDTDADLSFLDESPLKFEKHGDLLISNFSILLQNVGDPSEDHKMNYRMLISEKDKFVYAGISDYKAGTITIDNDSFDFVLYLTSKSRPFFDSSGSVQLVIDFNMDGVFSNDWALSNTNEIVTSEAVDLSAPFILKNEKLEVKEISPVGDYIVLRKCSIDTAVACGFKAPRFSFVDIYGGEHHLEDFSGNLILLEFWSVHCPFSESIVDGLNSLHAKYGSENLTLISFPTKGESLETILQSQATNPRNSIMSKFDTGILDEYDINASPTYVLIGKDGDFLFKAVGASKLKLLDFFIDESL